MKILLTSISLFCLMLTANSQSKLPYYEIPEEPKKYTAGSVASRTIDGLGFRYYWATENLNEKDLQFKPSEKGRTVLQTVDHILVLSILTLSAVEQTEMKFPEKDELSFEQMRKMTLENFKKASDILKSSTDLSKYVMKIKRRNGTVEEYPFWNQLNGPIADAIWHCGQIVSFRRTSGNSLPEGVQFLTGKVKR